MVKRMVWLPAVKVLLPSAFFTWLTAGLEYMSVVVPMLVPSMLAWQMPRLVFDL